ncbi:DUF721 domain-containing protein [Roseomonas sp. M0104]|uniref:DUF721 domain-containing protein n=1 Tax=Teichococcus coralli TaxID=2545983 RepID=A0A845B7N4_9PROT|nr:DUF721 domain-containing protein [Pseudoroseomonas coralli]MXP62508.1 DUF721 domain-containing protein [Pseudoroseomonas coralli]
MQEEDEPPRGSSPRTEKPEEATRPAPVWRADLGPRPLSALLPRLTRPAFKRRSPAAAHLMTDWPEIVGPALAAQSMPLRMTGGTLTLRCAGPMAMELQHMAPQLVARINTALGQRLVERLRFVQGAMPPPAPRAKRPPPAKLPAAVSEALEAVPDPELRAALARLGQGVYRRR